MDDGTGIEGAQDLGEKIRRWMQAQGYPLEMQIAQVANEAGFMAQQGLHYYDSDQKIHRETDVVVTTSRKIEDFQCKLQFRVVFEAKSSAGRSKPWVILADRASGMGRPARVVQRYVNDQAKEWWKTSAGRNRAVQDLSLFGVEDVRGYSLVRPNLGTRESRDDQAFAALMQVSKAAHGICEWLSEPVFQDTGQFFAVVLPVIVVDSPLYECWLGDDGQLQVEEVNIGTVRWGNRVSLRRSPMTIIKVMRLDAVDGYLQHLREAADVLAEDCRKWMHERQVKRGLDG